MAAPTPVTRVTPAGIWLDNGFRITLAFERDPDVSIWEKTVQIPGIDGGDAIETTTQHNTALRTFAPRDLVTLTPFTFKGSYDPACITQIRALVNQPGAITETLPDGSAYTFYGYLQKAEFDEYVEGTQPEGTFTVVPTNYDPVNHVEAEPVFTSVSGT